MNRSRSKLGLRLVITFGAGVLFLFVGAMSLSAQQIYGRMLGSVADASGAAVPSAQITVTNQDTGVTRTTVSASDGLYNVPQVVPGTYTVEAVAQGFNPTAIKDITVTVDTDSRVDLKLQIGAVTQSVTVTEAVPLVDTTSSSVGSTVDEQRVADLPLNGRNWVNLTLLQPGITQAMTMLGTAATAEANGIVFSSNGAGIQSNAISLDGANERNLSGFNSSSMTNTTLGIDGIQEYRVVTSLFGAEYGLSMGSQTTIVSKGGTNQFHGDAFDYLRNASLDARNYFDALDTANANGFGTGKSAVYPDKRIPPFRRNNFGGSFGGPIKRDKTFFYAVYEGVRQQTGITITLKTFPIACFIDPNNVTHATIPSVIKNAGGACTGSNTGQVTLNPVVVPLAALYPQPNVVGYSTFNYTYPYLQPAQEDYGQIRVDHVISSKDTIFFRDTHDVASEVSNYNFQAFQLNLASNYQFTTLGENHVFTPTVLNTFRLSSSRTAGQLRDYVDQTAPNAPGNLILVAGVPNQIMGTVGPGGGISTVGADVSYDTHRGQAIYTGDDDVFWTKGKHAFKFGTLINYFYDYPHHIYEQAGNVSFSSIPNFFSGDYSSITEMSPTINKIPEDFRYITAGFYAQDDYRVTNRLTLNLGLRYEFATVPIEPDPSVSYSIRNPEVNTTGVPGRMFANPTLHNFSPRIGFAWDVTGKGKTSIRGGAGIYYDITNYGLLMTANGDGTLPASEVIVLSNAAATPAIPLTIPVPSNLPPSTFSPRAIAYYMQQPTLLQHSLEIDQQLPWAMAMTVGYVGSRGWHIMQEEEGNPTMSVGTDSLGLPVYGCWSAATTSNPVQKLAVLLSNGSCPAGSTSTGPRVNSALGSSPTNENTGDSYFNSLQIALNKRISEGLQFQFSYELSKSIDDGQSENPVVGEENVQAPFNRWDDRGPSSFDAPQSVKLNVIYHAPNIQSDNIAGKLLSGWWFSSILSARSGFPFSPTLSSDREMTAIAAGFGNVERPNLDPSFNAHKDITGTVAQWFDPTEFDLQPAGYLGTAGRDILRGPGFEDVDFSIVKDTRAAFLGEAGSIEFRTEFFNILNHSNFGNPNGTVYSGSGAAGAAPAGRIGSSTTLAPFASAGQITSTVSNSRQIQFALKLIF